MSPPSGRRIAAGVAATAAAGGAAWLAARARAARAGEQPLVPGLEPNHLETVTSADGTEIHVEEFGPADAPPVVLVHAWMCSLELWHRQIAELSEEARIIAFDLRGHGRSGLARSLDYSIESFGDDLSAVLDARLAEGERAVIAGHSMGGMTVAAWSHRHHEQVARSCSAVAMIGTGLGGLITESLLASAPPQLHGARERIGQALLSAEVPFDGAPEGVVRGATRYIAFGPNPRPDDVALVARMVRECPRQVRGRSGGTLSRMDVFDGLAHLDVPASVIAGAEDRMTPPVHSHRLAERLPRAPEVIVAPGSGHMVPLEADEIVTAELRRLLAETAPSKRRRRRAAAAG